VPFDRNNIAEGGGDEWLVCDPEDEEILDGKVDLGCMVQSSKSEVTHKTQQPSFARDLALRTRHASLPQVHQKVQDGYTRTTAYEPATFFLRWLDERAF
jgi:hypothetical protein